MKRITALAPTARPQVTCLLTLVTQDGRRHTVRLLKQSEVFGN